MSFIQLWAMSESRKTILSLSKTLSSKGESNILRKLKLRLYIQYCLSGILGFFWDTLPSDYSLCNESPTLALNTFIEKSFFPVKLAIMLVPKCWLDGKRALGGLRTKIRPLVFKIPTEPVLWFVLHLQAAFSFQFLHWINI